MKSLKIDLSRAVILMLVVLCLLVTIIQGTSLSSIISRNTIMFCSILPIVVLVIMFIWLYIFDRDKITEDKVVFAIIFSAMLLHCCYVLLSGLYDRQHDEGVYTGIATTQINPGHLGYIEYIYKFHALPNINPYELFSFYHPPLHFIISALWITLLTALGMPEDLAFENLQILPLFYSGLLMLVTYKILKKIGGEGKGLYVGLFFVAMHPSLIIMSGSINNDMLSTLLLACCILYTLCFIRERSLKNLMLIAFSIGFGMISKVNVGVAALPIGLVFLMDFIGVIRSKDKEKILNSVKQYVLFGITSAVIGLSWIVRNLIKFHEKPGVPVPGEASILYTGNYSLWELFGIAPFSEWHFEFPFHPLSGKVIHNIWVIMFQTSLFAEEYPAGLEGVLLFLCQFVYVATIILAIAATVFLIFTQYKKYKTSTQEGRFEALFLVTGYIAFLFGFAFFTWIYPYTCSSDFRYIVICLVYVAIGLADKNGEDIGSKWGSVAACVIKSGVCLTLVLTTIIYMTWNRW